MFTIIIIFEANKTYLKWLRLKSSGWHREGMGLRFESNWDKFVNSCQKKRILDAYDIIREIGLKSFSHQNYCHYI